MSSVTYPIRVDEDLKNSAAEVADDYGFDLPSVTRAFWKQMVRTRSIPLTLAYNEPNDESLGSIQETERIIAAHKAGAREGFENVDDMFAAIGN